MKPINPAFFKTAQASQCFYCGIAPNANKDNSYSRVNVDAIDVYDRSIIEIDSDSSEELYNRIRAKYTCGRSAAAFIHPICILIISLSYSDGPLEDFIVVPIKGLGSNGRTDPRKREVGYLCFIKRDVKLINKIAQMYHDNKYHCHNEYM